MCSWRYIIKTVARNFDFTIKWLIFHNWVISNYLSAKQIHKLWRNVSFIFSNCDCFFNLVWWLTKYHEMVKNWRLIFFNDFSSNIGYVRSTLCFYMYLLIHKIKIIGWTSFLAQPWGRYSEVYMGIFMVICEGSRSAEVIEVL